MDRTSVSAFASAGLRTGRTAFHAGRRAWVAVANGPITTESAGVQTSISFTPRAELEVRPPVEDDLENPAVAVQVSYGKSSGQKRGRDPTQALDDGPGAGPLPKKSCLKKVGGSSEERFGSALFGGRKAKAHAKAVTGARALARDIAQDRSRRHVRFSLPPAASPTRGHGTKRTRGEGEEQDNGREVKRLRLEKQNCEVSIEILKAKLSECDKEREFLAKKCAALTESVATLEAGTRGDDREASRPPALGSSEPSAGLRSEKGGHQCPGAGEASDADAEGGVTLAGSGESVAAQSAAPSTTMTISKRQFRGMVGREESQSQEIRLQKRKVKALQGHVRHIMKASGWGDPTIVRTRKR